MDSKVECPEWWSVAHGGGGGRVDCVFDGIVLGFLRIHHGHECPLPRGAYRRSGAAWNDNKISEKCWDLAIERRKSGKHLRSHDQDILNILLNNDILLLTPKYNYIYNLDMKSFFQKQS